MNTEKRTDLAIVILPGIMASELRTTDGELVWSSKYSWMIWTMTFARKRLKALKYPSTSPPLEAKDFVSRRWGHFGSGKFDRFRGYDRLIDTLENIPTIDAANIIKIPYDWRRPHLALALDTCEGGDRQDTIQTYLRDAIKKVEDARNCAEPNCNKPRVRLVIIGHSMGAVLAQLVLDRDRDLRNRVALFVAIGAPWRGAIAPGLAIKNQRGTLGKVVRSFPSMTESVAWFDTAEDVLVNQDLPKEHRKGRDALIKSLTSETLAPDHLVVCVDRRTPSAFSKRRILRRWRLSADKEDAGDGVVHRKSSLPYGTHLHGIHCVSDEHTELPSNDEFLCLLRTWIKELK